MTKRITAAVLLLASTSLVLAAADKLNILKDSAFATLGKDNAVWVFQSHAGATTKIDVKDAKATFTIENTGTEPWHLQLLYPKLFLTQGQQYTAKFTASGTLDKSLGVIAMKDGEPWTNFGDTLYVPVSSAPKEITYTFTATETLDNGRLSFQFGNCTGSVTLSNVSLVAE
jgi:Carbohydrate binding domain